MNENEISKLKQVEKLLLKAENILARFNNCPADSIIESANEACGKIEDARDILSTLITE